MELLKKKAGQSLVEIIIAISIGVIIVGSAVGALLFTVKSSQLNRANQGASPLAQELLDNVRSVAEGRWQSIYCLLDSTCLSPAKGSGTPYSLAIYKVLSGTVTVTNGLPSVSGSDTIFNNDLVVGDKIIINSLPFTVNAIGSPLSLTLNTNYPGSAASGLSITRDFSIRDGAAFPEQITYNNIVYTRSFTVENVRRENCGRGNITTNPETFSLCSDLQTDIFPDPSTQRITAKVTWPQDSGTSEVSVVEYITRSKNDVSQFSDWSGGPLSNPNDTFTQPNNKYVEKGNLNTVPPGELNLP